MVFMKDGKAWASLVLTLTLLIYACLVGMSFASGGGGEGGDAHESNMMLDLLYRVINFTLLVIILLVVIKKTNAFGFLTTRRDDIQNQLDELKSAKNEADSRYKELEEKLGDFEKEKGEIVAQFKQEGLAEKERIIAEAEERAKQILKQTDLTIEREIEAARDQVKEAVVEIAAQRAEEIIKKEIKESDQDNLVDEFIEKLEKLH